MSSVILMSVCVIVESASAGVLRQQPNKFCRRRRAEILVTRSVAGVDPAKHEVFLDGSDIIRAHSFILATGVTWRRLAIEGIDRLIGKGVFYGAARSEANTDSPAAS
jgi:alkyl hydroperoxide reductase subunit AhpF